MPQRAARGAPLQRYTEKRDFKVTSGPNGVRNEAALPVRVAAFNVNGVNGRLPRLLEWLAESQPDIVAPLRP